MEVLRRTGPVVRLQLLRRAFHRSHNLPPVPPLQSLRHSHSFHAGSLYRAGHNKIQEQGTLRREHIVFIRGLVWNNSANGKKRLYSMHSINDLQVLSAAAMNKFTFPTSAQTITHHVITCNVMFLSLNSTMLVCTLLDSGLCAQTCFPASHGSAHCVNYPSEQHTPADTLDKIPEMVSILF